MAQELVLLRAVVVVDEREAARGPGHSHEVGQVRLDLVLLVDGAALDLLLLDEHVRVVGVFDDLRRVEQDLPVVDDVLVSLVLEQDLGLGFVVEQRPLEVDLALVGHLRVALVEQRFELGGLLGGFLALGAEEHFLELEHVLELQEQTVLLLELVGVRVDAHFDDHFLLEVLALVAEFGFELRVRTDVLFLTALEDHVVYFPAGAGLVLVVGGVEAVAALRAEADLVLVNAQQLRRGGDHALAFLAVEVPAAHEAEEVHAVGPLALRGLEDAAGLRRGLFEKVEGPVVLAEHVHDRGVQAGLQRVALQVRVRRVGCGHGGRGRVGGDGEVSDRGVDGLLLEGRGVLRDRAVEVRVLDEPLELGLAAELMVHADVDELAARFLLELHAALEVDLREHLGLLLLALALVISAVVLDFALVDQDRARVLQDAGLLDLEVVAGHDAVHEHLGRELVAVEGFFVDLDRVDLARLHLRGLVLHYDCDEVCFFALA